MRWIGWLAVAGLAAGLGSPAGALCIRTNMIDHTEIKGDTAILFYMNDRHVYRNDLAGRCPTLGSSTNGFTYEPTDPSTLELCDNLATFRVNGSMGPSFSNGPVCLFGKFTQIK